MQESDEIIAIKKWLGTGSINIFGRPFAGKDTQGRILAELLGGSLLGGGEIMRSDTIPDNIKAIMRSGLLIPSDEYIKIVLPHLSHHSLADKPLILSSVGRWSGEETSVIEATAIAGHPIKIAINLNIDEDTVRFRWRQAQLLSDRGNRHDDTEEKLEIRLNEFKDKTMPVLKTYQDQGLLIEFDADKDKEAITQTLISKIIEYIS